MSVCVYGEGCILPRPMYTRQVQVQCVHNSLFDGPSAPCVPHNTMHSYASHMPPLVSSSPFPTYGLMRWDEYSGSSSLTTSGEARTCFFHSSCTSQNFSSHEDSVLRKEGEGERAGGGQRVCVCCERVGDVVVGV